MRRGAVALVLLLLSFFARADAPQAPPPEQLAATADSPFVKRILAQPSTTNHHATMVAVKTLEYSRNVDLARLLERSEQRRVLAQITGAAYELPATREAAIEQERGLPPLDVALGQALGRIAIEWASAREPGAFEPERPAQLVRDGMWTAQEGQLTSVWVLLSIRNGLALPIYGVSVAGGKPGDGSGRLSCEARKDSPRATSPGAQRVLLCWASDRTERIGPFLAALETRTFGPLRAANVETTASTRFHESAVYWEEHRDNGTREAFEALGAASCQDKGTCPAVAQAQAHRAEAEQRQRAPSQAFGTGAVLCILLGMFAAAVVKPRPAPGVVMPILTVLVIAFAAFTLATGYYSLQPGASVAWMLPLAAVYFGALPGMLALAALVGSLLNGQVTRLRAFATAFGAGVAVLTLVTMAQYR